MDEGRWMRDDRERRAEDGRRRTEEVEFLRIVLKFWGVKDKILEIKG
jgi:hypothetical protein